MSSNVLSAQSEFKLGRMRLAVSIFFFAQGFSFATWASRIPDIKTFLDLSEASLGSVLLAIPLGQLFTLPLSGRLVNRYGSRKVLSYAPLMYASILVLMGLAPNIWWLTAALFLFGIVGNLCNIAINAQGVAAEKLFGRSIMTSFHGAWSLAGFVAALFALLMMHFGLSTLQHFCVVALMMWTMIFLNFKHLIPARDPSSPVKKLWQKPDPDILALGIIGFCCMAAEGAMFDWSGVYFREVVKTKPELVSLGYAAFMIAMASGRFLGDILIERFGRRRVLTCNGVLISFGMILAVLFPYIWPATIGFLIVGFGVSCVVPAVYSAAGRSTTMSPGLALASVTSIGFLGFLLGPPVIGYIAAATSLRISYALIAICGLLVSYLVIKPGSVFEKVPGPVSRSDAT